MTFSELTAYIPEYDEGDVYVEYSDEGGMEVAVIKSRISNEVLETINIKRIETRSGDNTYAYILSRSKVYAGYTIKLDVHVEMYSYGSFRQINSVEGAYLTIADAVTNIVFEDEEVNAWAPNKIYPATEILYSFSATLMATVTEETSSEATAALLDSGFSYSYTAGTETYYRCPISDSGSFSLY